MVPAACFPLCWETPLLPEALTADFCLGPIDLICVTSAFKGSWQSKEQDCRNWLQLIISHSLGLRIPLPIFFKCSALKEEGGLGTGYDTQVSTTASIYGAYISPPNIHH